MDIDKIKKITNEIRSFFKKNDIEFSLSFIVDDECISISNFDGKKTNVYSIYFYN